MKVLNVLYVINFESDIYFNSLYIEEDNVSIFISIF